MAVYKNFKKTALIVLALLALSGVFYALRGPNISNFLKKAILPELEALTGYQLIAQKIYVNLFPFFIEAKELKAFDKEGNKVLTIQRAKCYIGLTGILNKKIDITRAVLKVPRIWTDEARMENLIKNINQYLSKEGRGLALDLKALEIRDGEVSYHDGRGVFAGGKGIDAGIIFRKEPEVDFSIKEANAKIGGLPEIKASVGGRFLLGKNEVNVKKLDISSYGSKVEGSGVFSGDGTGVFETKMNLLVDSFKKLLGLKRSGEGKVNAKGVVKFTENLKDPYIEMKLRGEFFIETLMEILKVKERLEGLTSVDGRLEGHISDLKGRGDVRLRNGNLFDIDIDDLRCKVFYGGDRISFKEGNAKLYGGEALAEATLNIPVVDRYSLTVNYSNVDSTPLLKLIGLNIAIPHGHVRGMVYSSGKVFSPEGWFEYEGVEGAKDVLGRIKQMSGGFVMRNGILNFSKGRIMTGSSAVLWEGKVNVEEETLDIGTYLETSDIRDLTAPYYTNVKGKCRFEGKVTGTFEDPLIAGSLRVQDAYYETFSMGDMAGRAHYSKNLLEIKGIEGRAVALRGTVGFPDAREIFDLKNPLYNVSLTLNNAEMKELTGAVYKKDFPLKGTLDAALKITGTEPCPEWSGSVSSAGGASAYGFDFSYAGVQFSYDYKKFIAKEAVFRRGQSRIYISGWASKDGDFSFRASSDKLNLTDIIQRDIPVNYEISFEAKGDGSFKEPHIDLKGRLTNGRLKLARIGEGFLNAALNKTELVFDFKGFEEKVALKGSADLRGDIPWKAELNLGRGRYDFLLSAFLKEVPEDMLLSLKGSAALSGSRSSFKASAVLKQVNVALFGQSFSNDDEIRFKVADRKVTFPAVALRSGSTFVRVSGDMELGRSYDIALDGISSLSPLKGFLKDIDVLRGRTDFVFAVTGGWERPDINGGISVSDASFALKNITQRLGSINAYIYVDKDRLVIQKFSAHAAGGDVNAEGIAYLRGFGIEKFYIDVTLRAVSTSLKRGLPVNFGGNLIYRGSLDSQEISGELTVNKARYLERIEWKSWLIKARQKEAPKAVVGFFDKTKLNVRIKGSENIVIDNNVARAPLKVDITLRGTAGNPVLFGRLETDKGKIYFRNNEFVILGATADFSDPVRINPAVDVLAETNVKGYHIRLELEGQIDRFNLTLSSEPPLDEVSILGLLTVGKFGGGLKGLEGGVGAAEATAFITGQFQDVMEERLRDITGLDRFQIDPYVSKSTGMITPRLTVSKRLAGERLFVTYSSVVGTTEEQILKMEYFLKKNISLVGIRDERGSIGGDIKFRFEFK